MKIAIHHVPGSFSDEWVKYCDKNRIEYKLVCCYETNILEQLNDCDGLMWHWRHEDYKANLFARQLIFSLEKKGIKIFPNADTCWHYDDKVGQKYLLEAIGAPLVPSYVFYTKNKALAWLDQASFPKVFKLRNGAGSINVKLIKTKSQAKNLINKAFGRGFKTVNNWSGLKDRIWRLKRDKSISQIISVFKGIGRLFIPTEFQKFSTVQKGYIYFQDFIPDNNYDTRLVVIGDRCFGVRRFVRENDFRASGSGLKAYEPELFDLNMIKIAFDATEKLNAQSVAFDFIYDKRSPKIVEISYAFVTGRFYRDCQGYWDHEMVWYDKEVNPEYFMIEDFIKNIREKNN
jgi:glutathione synthase/RimK-type ligase-like ATP-grasp enzyme